MYSYNFLFYLYLIIVLSTLLVFAFFVSLQLKLFGIYFFKFMDYMYTLRKKFAFLKQDYSNLFSLHLICLEYTKCIALSELFLENIDLFQDEGILYSSLGFIYNEISFFAIAEYYYLEALSYRPNDIALMLNLAKVYSSLGYNIKAKLWLDKVSVLDPSFSMPVELIK
uniref:Uncharacterized protein n=1 Tax=Vertebrata isogona TaxID=2006944 RepID=A0A1Z1MEV0_9FLOR|nr:hypothetical protein [Vertebrata isogona]ARW64570.1 hypothetical protein [Vertebrata isogona]